jgi:hypothetical protein
MEISKSLKITTAFSQTESLSIPISNTTTINMSKLFDIKNKNKKNLKKYKYIIFNSI